MQKKLTQQKIGMCRHQNKFNLTNFPRNITEVHSEKKVPGYFWKSIFQKCFIFWPIKSIIIWCRWMSSFWCQTCKIWLINKSSNHFNGDRRFEKLQMLPFHQHTEQICSSITCSVQFKWLHLQLLKTYLSPFKWLELCYLSTDSFKFGIKMKKTFTCFT